MVQLRDSFERIESTGAQIVGLSYDSLDTLHSFSQSERIPFLLLSDSDSETIHAYGLHFQEGLPHPGTVLVDGNGVIRRKLFKDGYIKRHDIDELVSAIEAVK